MVASPATSVGTDAETHYVEENRDLTKQEQNEMDDRIRAMLLGIYGQDAYETSISEGERKKTEKRVGEGGFSISGF